MTDTKTAAPEWPTLEPDHPLERFVAKLPEILQAADYDEVYGVELRSAAPFHVKLILQKFLRADQGDLDKASARLLKTLQWRKSFQPLRAREETFSKKRFGGLGFVVLLQNVPDSPNAVDIATFNIYGAVKDPKLTFEDLEGFLRWRVGLMELGIAQLKLNEATEPIPDYGKGDDRYQAFQIHDYLQVSFLRQNPYTKAASKRTIDLFKEVYPETLSRKFFVNVPIAMGWMFSAVSMFLSKETVQKFTVLSYGEALVNSLGPSVPAAYGGKGPDLSDSKSLTPLYDPE